MAATATAALTKFFKLHKEKQAAEAKVKAIKAEIDKTEPQVIDWFQKHGTESHSMAGLTAYIRRDLFAGRDTGVDDDKLAATLDGLGLSEYAPKKANMQKLRGLINEHDQSEDEPDKDRIFEQYPALKGVMVVNEVFKIGVKKK